MKDTTLPGSLELCPSSGTGPLHPGSGAQEGGTPTQRVLTNRGVLRREDGPREAGRQPGSRPSAPWKRQSLTTISKLVEVGELPCVTRGRPGPGRKRTARVADVGRHPDFSHDFQLITDAVAASPSENHPNYHHSNHVKGEGRLP